MTNQLQTGSDASVYPFPHSAEEVLLDEPMAIESPRPIEVGESVRAYNERMRELSEEASRLALSSVGESNAEVPRQAEVLTNPEIINDIENVIRLITAAREAVILEVSEHLSGLSKVMTNGQTEVAKEEDILAKNLLTDVPENEEWKLYLHEGDAFVERSVISQVTMPYSSVHYMRDPNQPNRMIKSEMFTGRDGLNYEVVSQQEMTNLLVWLRKYYSKLIAIPETIQARKQTKRRLFN